mmetsp:Transcript_12143/g.22324  ORF Transcript_12143/g.22324 Transcript_12143/m.22324 type:complete len:460 (-) Transcript_12143:33-1412(-)
MAAPNNNVHPPWVADGKGGAGVSKPPVEKDKTEPNDATAYKVAPNFTFIRALGKGTYGSVAAFHDSLRGQDVAIKKIRSPFRNKIDAKRCLREIKLLRALIHEGIIKLLDVLPPPGVEFSDVYIVTELMDADLHTVIKSDQPLSDDHIQFFIYQILCAILYLHSANVVHRDLKPLNVLVNKNCDCKLCDFGLARGRAGMADEDMTELRTEYVGTRWYRAPEVVLTSMEYTASVDMWSVGCILGELIGRQPMFQGGDFLDQLRSICEVLGTPSEEDMKYIPSTHEGARQFMKNKYPAYARKSWEDLYPSVTELQKDLLNKLLIFDPKARLTAYEALRHPYLAEYHCEEEEVTREAHVDWSFEDNQLDTPTLQRMVYQEAYDFHPEMHERDAEELERRRFEPEREPLPRLRSWQRMTTEQKDFWHQQACPPKMNPETVPAPPKEPPPGVTGRRQPRPPPAR